MGIMDIFRGGAVPQQQAPQAQPSSVPAADNPSIPVPPNSVAAQPTPAGEPSPMADFEKLWDTKPKSHEPVTFNVDSAKLNQVAGQIDFAKVIKPEQLQAITQGGEGAVQALAQALNSVSQTVYAQSAAASAKIVEQALAKAEASFASRVPDLVRSQQSTERLSANPLMQHAASKPVVAAIKAQIEAAHPNATSEEIAQLTNTYFNNFAALANGGQANGGQQAKPQSSEFDWGAFFQS